MMIGLDTYAGTKRTFVGIDWLNLASGTLKGAGGAFGGAGSPDATAAAVAKAQAEAQAKAAQAQADMWKKVGIVAALVVVVGGVMMYKKAQA